MKADLRPSKPRSVATDIKIKTKHISRTKPIYDLALGPKLLNRMMNSYSDSLNRKRKSFNEQLCAMELLKEKIKNKANLKKLIEEFGIVKLYKKMNVSYKTMKDLCNEWNVVAKRISALEQLKNKIKTKEKLIEMIESFGKDKTSKNLKTGYKTLETLMEEWEIDANYLSVKDKLKRKIGNKKNLALTPFR